jgi:hypothetical protein
MLRIEPRAWDLGIAESQAGAGLQTSLQERVNVTPADATLARPTPSVPA